MTPEGGGAALLSKPQLIPGLAYLNVMAIRDHDIFLGQQVLDTILRDDVLYLKGGGRRIEDGMPTYNGCTARTVRRAVLFLPRVGPGQEGKAKQQLTWLSEVTRCCTVWPSAVVISWI